MHTAASVVKDTVRQLAALNDSTRLLDREVHNTIEDEIQDWGKYRQFQDDQLRIAADIQRAYNSTYHDRIVGMLLSALENESNNYFNFLNSSSICSVGQCKVNQQYGYFCTLFTLVAYLFTCLPIYLLLYIGCRYIHLLLFHVLFVYCSVPPSLWLICTVSSLEEHVGTCWKDWTSSGPVSVPYSSH